MCVSNKNNLYSMFLSSLALRAALPRAEGGPRLIVHRPRTLPPFASGGLPRSVSSAGLVLL